MLHLNKAKLPGCGTMSDTGVLVPQSKVVPCSISVSTYSEKILEALL